MSQGLAQYEQTIAGYGNSIDSIKAFTSNYDTEFFRDWTEKHNLSMEKLKAASDVSGGIGGAYLAGKLGIQSFRKRQAAKKKKNDGDEDGDEEADEDEPEGFGGAEEADEEEEFAGFGDDADAAAETGQAAAAAPEAEEEFAGFGDDADAAAETGQAAADAGDAGLVAPEIGAPLGDTAAVELSTAAPEASAGAQAQAAFNASDGNLTTQFEQAPIGGSADAARLENVTGDGAEVSSDVPSTTATTATTDAATTATTDAATTATTATTDAATTITTGGTDAAITAGTDAAASALTDTALTVAAGAAEAVPFLGIFASIGIGLYELFHHPHKAPSAPPVATASSKGEMVLPSFDSVTDTPASSSAF